MTVFELRPIVDSPELQCFGLADSSAVRGGRNLWQEFYPDAEQLRGDVPWAIQRFGDAWTRRRVLNGLPGQVNDYPSLAGTIPTFSRRAVGVLRDLLEPNGELLALDSDEGPDAYQAFNVTTVLDALDHDGSDIEWHAVDRLRMRNGLPRNLQTARAVHRFVLRGDLVKNCGVFRLPELSHAIFVNQDFGRRVEEASLQGLNLIPIWSEH